MSKYIFILDKIYTLNNNLAKLCNYDSNFTLDKYKDTDYFNIKLFKIKLILWAQNIKEQQEKLSH